LVQVVAVEQLQTQSMEFLAKMGQRLLLLVLVFLLALQVVVEVVATATALELGVGLEVLAVVQVTALQLLETLLLVKDLLEDTTLHVIHRIMDLVVEVQVPQH
jgi:hypothetical protein